MIHRRLFAAISFSLLLLFSGEVLFSQDKGESDEFSKLPLLIVPLEVKNVPSYIPMIVERLLATKIDSTDAYFVFDREIFDSILIKNDIVLPKTITRENALKIGQEFEIDNVLFGSIDKVDSQYIIDVKVLDIQKDEIVSESTETAEDIKDLQKAVSRITRTIAEAVLPEEVVTSVVESLDNAEEEEETAKVEESISAFEKIAQEDVNQALDLVTEPVREAIKESVRDDIVEEEVQNLFEEEKAAKKRKWQMLALIGLESSVQLGNILGSAALDYRIDSVNSWNNYMNSVFENDPYRSYTFDVDKFRITQGLYYLFTPVGNLGLTFLYKNMPDDLLSFSTIGRYTYAVSSILNISGYMAHTAAVQLGFYAQRAYMEYGTATTDFTSKYEDYRDAYIYPTIAEYTRTGLWALGLTGMVTAALLPGEKTPIILTEKSRKYLAWGQAMVSLGNLTSGIALNLRGTSEESWISENSSSGGVGDNEYMAGYISSEVLFYTSYAVYLSGAVLTWLGLTHTGSDNSLNGSDETQSSNLSFSIVPAPSGVTALLSLRLD